MNKLLLGLRKKLFHIVLCLFFLAIFYFDIYPQFITLTLCFLFLLINLIRKELLKYKKPFRLIKQITHLEKYRFDNLGLGALYMSLGYFVTSWLFPKAMIVAIVVLLVVDVSGSITREYKLRLHNRLLFSYVVVFILCYCLIPSAMKLAIISLLMPIFEECDVKLGDYTLNDNFYIPLLVGLFA